MPMQLPFIYLSALSATSLYQLKSISEQVEPKEVEIYYNSGENELNFNGSVSPQFTHCTKLSENSLSTLEFAGLLYESSIPDRSSSIPDRSSSIPDC
jgi:hypothetical protein